MKWQRKLAAPKTWETFQELYDRARVLEQHEKQCAESAASRDGTRKNNRKGIGHHHCQGKTGTAETVDVMSVNVLGTSPAIAPSEASNMKPQGGAGQTLVRALDREAYTILGHWLGVIRVMEYPTIPVGRLQEVMVA